MKMLAILATLGALAMTVILVYAFVEGSFVSEGRQLLAMPWGSVSLVDLYVGFLLFAAWILYREGITPPSLLWIAAVVTPGSLAISCMSLYVFGQARVTGTSSSWAATRDLRLESKASKNRGASEECHLVVVAEQSWGHGQRLR